VAIGSKDADKLRPVKPRPVPDEQEAQPLVCRVCGRSSPASAVFCDRCGSAFRDAELRQQLSWDRGDIVLEVGRSESAHLQLFDATASRRHAEVTFARGALCVKDLHAVNRTRINGQLEPIQGPTLLCPGDRVHFGADVRTYDAIVSCLAAEIRQRSRQ
jgi:ribosomal protein L40E